MNTGIVIWFNAAKGFGFIKSGDKEIFVHYTQIIGEGFKNLSENDKVEFDIYETDKGLQARNVKKL